LNATKYFFLLASRLALRAAPDNLSASVLNGCQVNLTWKAVDSATSYNIKRSATSGGPYTIIKNTPGTSFEDKRLPGDTIYFYAVSALNSAGQSVNSLRSAQRRRNQVRH
jgi:fibronectin type 3 domain-containing protein